MAAVFGGAGKWEQTKLLKEGVEILVATPGTFRVLFQMTDNRPLIHSPPNWTPTRADTKCRAAD